MERGDHTQVQVPIGEGMQVDVSSMNDTQRAPFFRCLSWQRVEWNESRESHSRAIECGCLTSNWGNFTAIPVPHPFSGIYANDVDGE